MSDLNYAFNTKQSTVSTFRISQNNDKKPHLKISLIAFHHFDVHLK